MKRRSFIETSGLVLAGLSSGLSAWGRTSPFKDQIIGHGSHQYKIDMSWGALNSNMYPVKDCHEMVQDSSGRIILLTNHVKNNIIIYDKKGNLIEVWGTEFPGAHGLTLNVEGGEDFLYITDVNRHQVIKTTLSGKTVKIYDFPEETDKYTAKESYLPTETCITKQGDLYVADGYGEQHIVHYNSEGHIENIFGGRDQFDNAHGICIDDRDPATPTLLITARKQNKLKRFSLQGEHIETIHLPGAFICRPVIHREHIYLATIWSGNGEDGTGFVSILDKNNKLISAPGGSKPMYKNGHLEKMHQTIKVFTHPHDVCVDDEENLYVAQWNSGQTYPIKLIRV